MPQLSTGIDTSTKQIPWGRFSEVSPSDQPVSKPFLWLFSISEPSTIKVDYHLLDLLGTMTNPVTDASASLTREVDATLEAIQSMGVRVEEPSAVYEYLLRFPDMIQTTKKITAIAKNMLPPARLSLKLYRDPEVDDEHLVLYARFRNYDESVMEKIREVRINYRELLVGKRGWLLLTTDFQPVG